MTVDAEETLQGIEPVPMTVAPPSPNRSNTDLILRALTSVTTDLRRDVLACIDSVSKTGRETREEVAYLRQQLAEAIPQISSGIERGFKELLANYDLVIIELRNHGDAIGRLEKRVGNIDEVHADIRRQLSELRRAHEALVSRVALLEQKASHGS